jgi:hypothetical protein
MKLFNTLSITVKDILIVALVLIVVFTNVLSKCSANRKEDSLRKVIQESSVLLNESEGVYSKVVKDYNSERALVTILQKNTSSLKGAIASALKTIKDRDQTILSLTELTLTYEPLTVEIPVYRRDTTTLEFETTFPLEDPFVKMKGSFDLVKETLKVEWIPGTLNLKIVMSETAEGLWESRVIGPAWIKVDNLEINSVPPATYSTASKTKLIRPLIGGGVSRMSTDNSLSLQVSGGIMIKNSVVLSLNLSTANMVGINFLTTF